MKTPEEIRKHIDSLLKQKGLPYAQISKMLGKGIAFMQQYIKEGRPLRLKEVDRKNLAEILNVPEQELTDLTLNQPLLPAHMSGVNMVADKITSAVSSFFKKPLPDTVGIEMLNVSACCGSGVDNLSENIVGIWQMPIMDFKSISQAAPEYIKIVKAVGDSMQPTINDGDFVFVDISNQSMGSDGIYCLSSETGLSIKRLQNNFNGEIIIKSDNKDYDSLSFKIGDIRILGRVVNIVNLRKI